MLDGKKYKINDLVSVDAGNDEVWVAVIVSIYYNIEENGKQQIA